MPQVDIEKECGSFKKYAKGLSQKATTAKQKEKTT